MVTVSPPRKSVDVELLRKINMGFSDGEYDEFDACDWLLDNAEAVLNTCQALADLVAAAEPILNDFPTQEQWDTFEAKLERARKVMKEE